ncbi:hypothetical protein SLNSH_21840 [Alsobacter soli]|uniref:Uncharacterized protein n=1 Tax=Alsobacter soli TaxID=2109933 RepID=A0A2T1HMG0_9HYPH|nr:type II toxin-antitoxin system PemK/MazF family toxin [Alsobacter soli]PSC02843.1 hypothetical protein SLNSH_21840 [Alsobacter soli]
MPHAFRIYNCLKSLDFREEFAQAVAAAVEQAKTPGAQYHEARVGDGIFDGCRDEAKADAFAVVVRHCYANEKHKAHYDQTAIKTRLVRAGIPVLAAEAFLAALDPAVVAMRRNETRRLFKHPPRAGRVVMCDFTHLSRPEMQKERRAIIVSSTSSSPGRCTVVPVSMTPPRDREDPHFHKFEPGAYPFFHSSNPVWACCDHVYTVGIQRLWQINIRHRAEVPSLSAQDLSSVRALVRNHLGLGGLTGDHASNI